MFRDVSRRVRSVVIRAFIYRADLRQWRTGLRRLSKGRLPRVYVHGIFYLLFPGKESVEANEALLCKFLVRQVSTNDRTAELRGNFEPHHCHQS